MTAIAVFDVLTDVSPKIINQKLNNIWIGQEADAILFDQRKMINCSLMYFYTYVATDPDHIESVRNVIVFILLFWRRYCFIENRAFKVFNKETKQNRHTSKKLLDKAFPRVPYSENKHVCVKGTKSPYDGDATYWSERNSKLYDGTTSKALKKQNHSCARCGYKLTSEEMVNLHHIDGNHDNWKPNNLEALHKSCHDYVHMSKARA
jgi:5-methylcytosine-specific restriction endonuclease McrA